MKLSARLGRQENREIAVIPIDKLLRGKAEAHEVCCFVRLAGSGHHAENYAALVPWKWVTLPKPHVASTLRMRRSGLELVVRSEGVAPFFHAELADTESHFRGDSQVRSPGDSRVAVRSARRAWGTGTEAARITEAAAYVEPVRLLWALAPLRASPKS